MVAPGGLTKCQHKSLAFSDGMNADDAYRQFPKTCVRLDHYSLSENQAKRVVLQEQLRVLGTRTPACGGKVRLVIFRDGKHIPVKQEALNSVESSSPFRFGRAVRQRTSFQVGSTPTT
jgi:hypothetical protein